MADYTTPPSTTLDSATEALLPALRSARLAVLCGRNNTGTSFLLRRFLQEVGETAFYLGPARYFNFNLFGAYSYRQNRRQQRYAQILNHLRSSSHNLDNSSIDLAQTIAELSDVQRAKLFVLLNRLFDSHTSIEQTHPTNSMSQKYVSVDGYNLAYQSSGFRLAAVLLACLVDEDQTTFIIDEPELGLSPEIQATIADFLYDDAQRQQYFAHVRSLIVATHSPLFLDRKSVSSNYSISRVGQTISIKQLTTIQDLNSLQFLLLGNRFETLHLPSAFVLVEGICDYIFLSRAIALRYPRAQVSVIHCGGDSRTKEVLAVARQMLGDLRRSPYADRIFVVLDRVHEPSLRPQLVDMGVAAQNIIVWDGNGIEYLYPRAVLEKKFGGFTELTITDDLVSANGIPCKKRELAEFVALNLGADTPTSPEIVDKLWAKLDQFALF
jgi:predicted ATPase